MKIEAAPQRFPENGVTSSDVLLCVEDDVASISYFCTNKVMRDDFITKTDGLCEELFFAKIMTSRAN